MTRRTAARAAARSGFTIIELMIVLVIIGVLASVVTINFVGAAGKAREKATKQSMATLKQSLEMYKAEYGSYPADLNALVAANIISDPAAIKDAWERDFFYMAPAGDYAFIIVSVGEDGVQDTQDDIVEYGLQ